MGLLGTKQDDPFVAVKVRKSTRKAISVNAAALDMTVNDYLTDVTKEDFSKRLSKELSKTFDF